MTAAIDGCVFHEWNRVEQLAPYMSEGWQEAVLRPGNVDGPNQLRGAPLYRHPFGRRDAAMYPADGPAGSDRALTTEHLLDGNLRERAVLGYDEAGLLLTAYTNPNAAQVAVRALNDWTLEHWLRADDRLYGLLLVSTAIPQEAAAEIRRLGADERIVGVALGTNGLDRPFGQAVYHPIYAAANEHKLPIVIQTGSDTAPSVFSPPIGGGMAATYAEVEAWGAHAPQTHLASLVMEGVFELFPDLRAMIVGGGVTWYPPFAWKLDSAWNHMRSEAPLLRERPSEYLRRHVRLSTAGMEHPADPELLPTVLGTMPWAAETLVYGSGYPERGWEDPDDAVARLPADWREAVLRGNALDFFRFPDSPAPTTTGANATKEGSP